MTAAGPTVRPARVADVEAMVQVLATVAEEGSIGTEPPVDRDALRARLHATVIGEGASAMWVLERDGRVVGQIGVHETRAAHVFSLGMAILPEGRRRGGGRALLQAVLEHARAHGAHKVELEVWPDNAPAIALYAGAGFEVEGLRRDHYRRRDGSLRSTLLMAILLDRDPRR